MVGRQVKDEEIFDISRVTLLRSSYNLYTPINKKPNMISISNPKLGHAHGHGHKGFNTIDTYDAKILEFHHLMQDGDYLWNVGGMHKLF